MSKVWFVTGSSKGFGREFVVAALERGDRVAATARNTDSLSELVEKYGAAVLPLRLDVTHRSQVIAAVQAAHRAFGRLDVVINNAGYGLFGAIEEISEQQLRDQLETNLFGSFHVTQAVLPILREQGSGHIIQISSIGGVLAFPNLGGYHASKWALEAFSDALSQEVAALGIKVTIVEPGGFNTDWNGASATFAAPQPQYDPIREAMATSSQGVQIPEPVGFGPAILKLVDAEKAPLRVLFGEMPLSRCRTFITIGSMCGPSGRTCPERPKVNKPRRNHGDGGLVPWTPRVWPVSSRRETVATLRVTHSRYVEAHS